MLGAPLNGKNAILDIMTQKPIRVPIFKFSPHFRNLNVGIAMACELSSGSAYSFRAYYGRAEGMCGLAEGMEYPSPGCRGVGSCFPARSPVWFTCAV